MFHVFKTFPNKIHALWDINLHIKKGEFVFLVGPTGAGKTTLLKLVYRGILPSKGQVIVDGVNLSRLKLSLVPYLRREIGIVFQDFKLLYDRNVFENVAFSLRVVGTKILLSNRRLTRFWILLDFMKRKILTPTYFLEENNKNCVLPELWLVVH